MNNQQESNQASYVDYLKALPQYVLPHFFLSGIMRRMTRIRSKFFRTFSINWVIKTYNVDMSLAENENINSYKTFNTFFTRKLKAEVRPIVKGADTVACPVDGTVSQVGKIEDGKIFQAKGRHYTLKQLIGYPEVDFSSFEGGQFATIYLSPRDYHRIHMPEDGKLRSMTHVPGRLFSVSPATTRVIPGLFARNERVVALFETDFGPVAVIPVGAIFVGSIETVWHGEISPPTIPNIRSWHYAQDYAQEDGPKPENKELNKPVTLEKGKEFGRFNMGSTVVLLFGPQTIDWAKEITAGASVKMGQLLATRKR